MIPGFGSLGTSSRKIVSPPAYSGVPMGTIRWDGNSNNPALPWYSVLSKYYGPTAKYNARRASQWKDSQEWGTGVNVQQIVDAELAFCKNKVDFWWYVWYPPDSIIGPGTYAQSNILKCFEAHFASPLKNNVKFAFIINGVQFAFPAAGNAAVWPNATPFANWVLDKMNDPNYMRIDGKPLVGVYNGATAGVFDWTPAHWNDFKAITGPVFGLAAQSQTLMLNLGLQGAFTYGPNGNQLSGTGEKTASALMAADATHWVSSFGSTITISTTFFQDARPFNLASAYADKHSQPQLLAHIQAGLAVPSAKTWIAYAHSEETEGGPGAAITFQEGSRHYDAMAWARGAARPARYTYELSCHSAATSGSNVIILSGTWAYQFPDPSGVQGAHDNDEMWTSTAGASVKLNLHDRLQSVTLIGSKAPGLGTATIKANGIIVGTADFNGSSAVRQPIFTWDFTNNPPVSGTFEAICDGTGQIRPDSFLITYKP